MQMGLAKVGAIPGQLKLKKALPERLRSMGLDEAWLQKQIAQDTSLLGLGELELLRREKNQRLGGRVDFIMADPDSGTRYVVEVMLDAVDESHIIRTIEYWDVERQRYPNIDHRAVIVAEKIVARFFNVIRLINQIPIIAIQLCAFRSGDEVILQFIKVLDTAELGAEPEEEELAEQVDVSYWQRKASPEALAIVESIRSLIPNAKGDTRLTYNKHHIALGTTGYNFCWFYPRKTIAHSHFNTKVGTDNRPDLLKKLENAGIDADNHRRDQIRLRVSTTDIEEHGSLITELLTVAEDFSHR